MSKVNTLGISLIGFSILVPMFYGMYLGLSVIQDVILQIPLIIRIGIALFIAGMVILMISLIRERIIDWKKENKRR
jgi:hypothetical protein